MLFGLGAQAAHARGLTECVCPATPYRRFQPLPGESFDEVSRNGVVDKTTVGLRSWEAVVVLRKLEQGVPPPSGPDPRRRRWGRRPRRRFGAADAHGLQHGGGGRGTAPLQWPRG